MPFFSVVIPVFSRYELLKRALSSVLNQTFKDYQCLIIDDGSPTSVKDLLPKDKRFQYIYQSRGGVSKARNHGIRLSKGKWIALLDSDDAWLEKKLEKQYHFIKENPQYHISQTQDFWIRNNKQVVIPKKYQKTAGFLFDLSVKYCVITPSSVVLSKALIDQIGLFDEKLPSCEDYDYWLRVTNKYFVGLIEEPLIKRYQGHLNQLSFQYESMDRFRVKALCKIYHRDLEDGKRSLVKKYILKKTFILYQGAFKRKRYLRAFYFFFLNRWYGFKR